MDVKLKIWIEEKGEPVLGGGRLKLLKAIGESGSLKAATEKLDISYRHAWGQIKKMENRLGFKLIAPRTGGQNGGGSTLTADAKRIVRAFESLQRDVNRYAEKRSEKLEI
ncbi:MAG: winged helix-turn-helix domain-containing protein [bacterium]